MNCMKSRKASEPSGVAIELFKAGGDKCLKSLTNIFNILFKDKLPEEWSSLVPIFKGKGDPQGIFQKFRAVCDIDQKGHFFMKKRALFLKKGPQKFQPPLSIPFLSVLHQNKAFHIFCKSRQHSIVKHNIGLEYALIP